MNGCSCFLRSISRSLRYVFVGSNIVQCIGVASAYSHMIIDFRSVLFYDFKKYWRDIDLFILYFKCDMGAIDSHDNDDLILYFSLYLVLPGPFWSLWFCPLNEFLCLQSLLLCGLNFFLWNRGYNITFGRNVIGNIASVSAIYMK